MSLKNGICTLLLLFSISSILHAQSEPQLSFSSALRLPYASSYAASAIAVGHDGNIVVAGHYQDNFGMGFWLSKIDPVNSRFVWATNYVPTQTYWNAPLGLVLDRAGNIYVADSTNVADFSIYFDGIVGSLKGPSDILIAKFSPDGRAMSATYLGGSGYENLGALGIDGDDNLYIAGQTSSMDFPVLNGLPPQMTPGFSDLFVAKISPDGTLRYGTHVPGSIFNAFGVNKGGVARLSVGNGPIFGFDALGNMQTVFDPNDGVILPFTPASLAVDDVENCFLTGPQIWSSYPDTSQPLNDVWVAKLSSSGNVIYQKKVASTAQDQARAIAVDTQGRAYVTGFTQGTDYPVLSSVQSQLNGPQDAFITVVNAEGNSLLYSTYLGGSDNAGGTLKDSALAIAVVGNDAYVAGRTDSLDFPWSWGLDSYDSYTGQALVALLAIPDYKLQLLFDADKAHHTGSTVAVKVAVLDQQDSNISSEALSITPVRLTRIGDATANIIEDSGQSSGDYVFRFDDSLSLGGGYIFNLSTKGLASGTYELGLKIGTDTYVYKVPLQLK